MIDFVGRLHNAPLLAQRALAVGFLLLLVLLVLLASAQIASTIIGLQASIAEKREQLGRLEAIKLAKPKILASLSNTADAISGSESTFLEGDSETVIRSNLQARISQIAADHNVNLVSVGNVPSMDEGDVRYIGLRADLTGPMAAVHAVIFDIESAKPMLFIREASIRVAGDLNGREHVTPDIVAQIHLYGALRPQSAIPASAGPTP